MSYLVLFPTVKYEGSKKNGCIYNFVNNSIIPLSPTENIYLNDLINNGIEIEKIEKNDSGKSFINKLISDGFAYKYEQKVFYQSYKPKCEWELRGLFETPPKFKNIYLQINNVCNYNCNFCNNESFTISDTCHSCMKWTNSPSSNLMTSNTLDYINPILSLNPENIIISGGNPLLNCDELKNTILKIRKLSKKSNLIVITNGIGITNDILNFFKMNNVTLRLIILGYDETSYQSITNCVDSYLNTIDIINKIRNSEVSLELASITTSNEIENIKDFCNKLVQQNVDIIKINASDSFYNKTDSISRNQKFDYWDNKKFNHCLYGSLALSLDGKLYPCPRINDELVDLTKDDFSKIFQDKSIDKYWRLTKDKLDSCKDCAYKYSCSNCTYIDIKVNTKANQLALCEFN